MKAETKKIEYMNDPQLAFEIGVLVGACDKFLVPSTRSGRGATYTIKTPQQAMKIIGDEDRVREIIRRLERAEAGETAIKQFLTTYNGLRVEVGMELFRYTGSRTAVNLD